MLPLRGKILNVASASTEKLRQNQELKDLVEALGCGVGERFDRARLRAQMAAALEAVEQQRIALIGNVSHELRTPLAGLEGYLEGLIDGVLPEGPETFSAMQNELRRLRRLVDDLQTLSRVEAGQVALHVTRDPGAQGSPRRERAGLASHGPRADPPAPCRAGDGHRALGGVRVLYGVAGCYAVL